MILYYPTKFYFNTMNSFTYALFVSSFSSFLEEHYLVPRRLVRSRSAIFPETTRSEFWVTFRLSAQVGRKQLVLARWKGPRRARTFFPSQLRIPALWPTGAGELGGSDPCAGPFWPEPPVLRTRAFHLTISLRRGGGVVANPPPFGFSLVPFWCFC